MVLMVEEMRAMSVDGDARVVLMASVMGGASITFIQGLTECIIN